MATWFRTRWNSIVMVEVEKHTDASVWIRGRRQAKRTDWSNYFETFEEARSFLLARCEERATQARNQLQRENDALGNVKGMKRENVMPEIAR